jgi:transposase
MYSKDFRKRAIEYMNEGHSQKELYEAFKIYPSTVNDWRKLLAETGELTPQYPKTRKGKIDLQRLEQEIERNPDATLSELALIFDCKKQSVHVAEKKLKITYKKNVHV